MKVYNDKNKEQLHENIANCLATFRDQKKFYAQDYIIMKADYLNRYMQKCGLDTCIIGVSGGVDSAIVLGLVREAQKRSGSPIKRILPVMLPAFENNGVTNQKDTVTRGDELCSKLGIKGYTINVNPTVQNIHLTLMEETKLGTDDWAMGQLVPYTRTPFLYGLTSLCSASGYSAIIVGTTNRDEGAYLGYVGKASDGLVDVQLISDLHKSEVYKVARELDLPESIISVTPAGDMYDNRCDTDVFGASYDFVEFYHIYMKLDILTKHQVLSIMNSDRDCLEQFMTLSTNLEKLHRYNRHKYIAHSPAVHLDLWDCSCPDGWINYYEITKAFMEE